MGRPASLPSTYNALLATSATAKRRGLSSPTTFTADSVKDAASLAKQLTDMQQQLAVATSLTRAQTPTVQILGQTFAANQSITFGHALNRACQWKIIGWRGATAGASFVESTAQPRTTSSITLTALVAGTADIELS